MKLIVREYLGMIREAGEFDVLLPDLLSQMSITPITKAQTGARQDGVDLPAIGKDTNGVEHLWLFVIKRGDIGRKEWDAEPQSVRQSLDEINDVYIRKNISPEHSSLPIKIIVTTTGDRKQVIDSNWSGYTENNTTDSKSYEFWNGDKVAALIVDNLLNGYILPPSERSHFRRALALIREPDYNLKDFYAILGPLLTWIPEKNQSKPTLIKKNTRSIKTANLVLAILCRWAITEGNAKNALIACERTLLWEWNAIIKANMRDNKNIIRAYYSCIDQYISTSIEYVNKVQSHLLTDNALTKYFPESVLLRERVFEELGILATTALTQFMWGHTNDVDNTINNAKSIAEILCGFLKAHKCSASPVYDGHSIDISLAILILIFTEHIDNIEQWLNEISSRLDFCYKANMWFPISSDSFDDLVDFEIGLNEQQTNKLKDISTLLPTIAQWAATLGLDDLYGFIYKMKSELLPETCCQLWYPEEKTDEIMYHHPAHLESGITDAPMIFPETADGMRSYMQEIITDSPINTELFSSATTAGIGWLDFIANRHFRTPLNPLTWQKMCIAIVESVTEEEEV